VELRVGSLVVPSPAFRSAMGTGEGAAVLLSLRRGNGHLFYTATDRAYWVPMRDVRGIPPEAVPEDCFERLLSDLVLSLEADECAVETRDEEGVRLVLEIPGLTRPGLHRLIEWLGPRLRDYAFEAGSMRAMVLRVLLADLPASAGEGR
jgi:hypothetical protein